VVRLQCAHCGNTSSWNGDSFPYPIQSSALQLWALDLGCVWANAGKKRQQQAINLHLLARQTTRPQAVMLLPRGGLLEGMPLLSQLTLKIS
jgi:endogenous inhibitor of DNA gyrase (YacG/DUF329 family)